MLTKPPSRHGGDPRKYNYPSTLVVYTIDPGISRFTVRAFASGMFSAFGHNPTLAVRDFEGEATFSPEAIDDSRLVLRIKAGSLSVTDKISDKDRNELESTMNQDVLGDIAIPGNCFRKLQGIGKQGGRRPIFREYGWYPYPAWSV